MLSWNYPQDFCTNLRSWGLSYIPIRLPALTSTFKTNNTIHKGSRSKLASHAGNSLYQFLGKGNIWWREVKAFNHLWGEECAKNCKQVLFPSFWVDHVPERLLYLLQRYITTGLNSWQSYLYFSEQNHRVLKKIINHCKRHLHAIKKKINFSKNRVLSGASPPSIELTKRSCTVEALSSKHSANTIFPSWGSLNQLLKRISAEGKPILIPYWEGEARIWSHETRKAPARRKLQHSQGAAVTITLLRPSTMAAGTTPAEKVPLCLL